MLRTVLTLALLCWAAPCRAQAVAPPDWLGRFVAFAVDPATYAAPVPDLAGLAPFQPLMDTACPALLRLAPDHPPFLDDAMVALAVPGGTCADATIALASFTVYAPRPALDGVSAALSARLGMGPTESRAGENHELRWQIGPDRAVVIQLGDGDHASLIVARAAQPGR